MLVGVLGTGQVGRSLAAGLATAGHEVVVGTRDPDATLARDDGDVQAWHAQHPEVRLATLAEAVAGADVVVDALPGTVALEVLGAMEEHLEGVVLLDVANALDFGGGFPPTLAVANDDSLGERLQRALPRTRVVKSLCTMNHEVMVDPSLVGDGEHTVFLSGDDADAKEVVRGLLADLGWSDVLDLGGIETARGQEMWLPLWLRVMGVVDGPFQLRIVRG